MAGKTSRRVFGLLGVATQFIVSTKAESLGALYDGSSFTAVYSNYGFTFEILAKDEALVIERLDVNMEAVTEDMKVFTKPGVLGTVTEIGANGNIGDIITNFEAGDTGGALLRLFLMSLARRRTTSRHCQSLTHQ